jgi:hypothetical protein
MGVNSGVRAPHHTTRNYEYVLRGWLNKVAGCNDSMKRDRCQRIGIAYTRDKFVGITRQGQGPGGRVGRGYGLFGVGDDGEGAGEG